MFPHIDFKFSYVRIWSKFAPIETGWIFTSFTSTCSNGCMNSTGESVRSVCGLSERGVPQPQGPPPPSRRLCPPDKTLATPRGRPFHSRRSISFCPRQNFFSAPFSCFSALDPASTPSSATPGFEKKLQFCERDFKLFGDIFVSGGNRRWTLDIVSVGKCSILHLSIQLNYTNNIYMNLLYKVLFARSTT